MCTNSLKDNVVFYKARDKGDKSQVPKATTKRTPLDALLYSTRAEVAYIREKLSAKTSSLDPPLKTLAQHLSHLLGAEIKFSVRALIRPLVKLFFLVFFTFKFMPTL